MNVVLAVFLSAWVSVLGEPGRPWGVVAPLQVAGVVAGSGILITGTALIIGYGVYTTWGQTRASVDATGLAHLPKRAPAATTVREPAPTTTTAPPAEPGTTDAAPTP